jgi:serine/threonine protein kinase
MHEPGQIIVGRYRTIKEIGRGGFGAVYLAEDINFNAKVILKIGEASHDTAVLNAFKREVSALMRIKHPNIVQIRDTGIIAGGQPFLALEWIDGITLEQLLKKQGSFSLPAALAVAQAVAQALAAAHKVNIIHRDIKPSNVIIPARGGEPEYENAKLTDFGGIGELNKLTGETVVGELFGTPYYMAPEQILAESQSPATDVYGLGVLLYEMLFGVQPFKGASMVEVFSKVIREEVKFPDESRLPAKALSFIRRCLDKDPQKRPPTATEALREIRELQSALYSQQSVSSAAFEPPATSRSVPELKTTLQPASQAMPQMPSSPAYYSLPQTIDANATTLRAAVAVPATRRALAAPAVAIISLVVLATLIWKLEISYRVLGIVAGIIFGLILVVGGVVLALALRRWLIRRRSQIAADANTIMFGSQSREMLTSSLALQVDEIVMRVRSLDEKILANTLAIMLKEYEAAKDCQDRMAALMNAMQLMEKLRARFSPWYVQYEKMITITVALIGVASGIASIAASLAQISIMKR